jgi:hypothetical protein
MVPPWDCRFATPFGVLRFGVLRFGVLRFGGPAMLQNIGHPNAMTCDNLRVVYHFCEFSMKAMATRRPCRANATSSWRQTTQIPRCFHLS